jgi:hypothetical protein
MQVRPDSSDAEAVVGALRACSYVRFPARSCSSGMAHPSSARTHSRMFGSRGAAKRLHVEQLPGYAPDLNPDEGVWNYREAASNWAMSAVPIYRTCIARSFALKSVCDTNRRSFRAALANVATCCSSFSRDQLNRSALKASWFFHLIQTSISTLRTFNLH